jgi:hypothetical protein
LHVMSPKAGIADTKSYAPRRSGSDVSELPTEIESYFKAR